MDKLRVDKWLWVARFFRTRGVALEAIKGGKVALNRQKPKPSKTLMVGDVLKITQVHRKIEIIVLIVSDKRGSADIAQSLYQLKSETLNQTNQVHNMVVIGYREKGSGRPTKLDRRKIKNLIF